MTDAVQQDEQPLSATEVVRGELMHLRKHDGITYRKVKACPSILGLPVTQAELERRGMAPSDRHVAAYNIGDTLLPAQNLTNSERVLQDLSHFQHPFLDASTIFRRPQ